MCDNPLIITQPMREEHVHAVAQIERESFTRPWSEADFYREIKENSLAHYFVACTGGQVIGYAGLWHIVTEGHITNVAVKEAYKGQGAGSMLLTELIHFARLREMIGLTLEVRVSNETAKRLYTKFGFKQEGIRKRYYEDTKEDALIMWMNF